MDLELYGGTIHGPLSTSLDRLHVLWGPESSSHHSEPKAYFRSLICREVDGRGAAIGCHCLGTLGPLRRSLKKDRGIDINGYGDM